MVERNVRVVNDSGLHARPASQFIAFVNKYKESEIVLEKDERTANAKSILNLLTMGLEKGTDVTVKVTGGDEEKIADEIAEFVKNLKG